VRRCPRPTFARCSTTACAAATAISACRSTIMGPACVERSDVEDDIGNAVARFTARRIERRLEDTLDFPPLPEIAHRIIRISADPYASVSDLARVVEIDPSLSAQVVSWASSPYYAAPGKVRSIQDAIVRVLGFDLVMNLALGLALGKTMRMSEGRTSTATARYWLQAVHCAAMVEGLAKAMPSSLRPATRTHLPERAAAQLRRADPRGTVQAADAAGLPLHRRQRARRALARRALPARGDARTDGRAG
jgi:hypothetical protein